MYRRAPFIWIASQSIDGLGDVRAFLFGLERRDEGKNRWFLFRRVFELPAAPDEAAVTVTVDGRYQLFVNGRRVGRGPARCSPLHQRTDTYDLRPHLRPGRNALAMLVHVYGVDTSWYETAKGQWQPVFGDGGLYCDGFARCGDTLVDVRSDEQWRVLECAAWTRDVPRVNWGLGFIEVFDARAMPDGWTLPDFDDTAWQAVHVLRAGGGPPDSFFGGRVIEPFPTLLPREIPFLDETPAAPARSARWYGVTPRPDLPVDQRLYEEPLVELPGGLVEAPDALLADDDATTTVRTTADREVSVLLDFGRIHAGYPFIELDAAGGEVIEVAAAESIPGEWRDTPPDAPRIDKDHGHGAHLFRYVARPGRQRFERFEWTAVRYLQVTVRDAPQGVRIRRVGSTATSYPAGERGRFSCSDDMLTRLWEVGRYTLRQCMHDGWEDCPSREQRQWVGDATVEFLAATAAFGPSIAPLNRQFLRHVAESQRSDGLTQMFAPGDHREYALIMPDWTLQWILNAEQHWLYTGDVDTVEAVFPAVQRALAWFERQIGANDLVADLPYWHFMDWAAFGRRGEAAPLNAQLVGALRAAARLAEALQSTRAARRYAALANRIGAALNARHWDPDRRVYVDVVDPATGRQEPRVSQHANAGLILWGVAPRERWPAMIAAIADPTRLVFTAAPPIAPHGEPFDENRHVVLANTFYSHFVYRALSEAGRFDRALALIRERYGRMLARGATTLWESFDPTASLCHGFSATPVFQLSTDVLGIAPTEPGFTRFRLAPQFADLEYARGVFPTARGDIPVQWTRDARGIELNVVVPVGSIADIVAPAGYGLSGNARRLLPGARRVRFVPTPR